MTYSDALAVCRDEDAELASFTDRYQAAFIKTVLYNNRFDEMWHGLMVDDMVSYLV